MKNRNLVIFVVLSMGLLLGYSYLVGKLYPAKPVTATLPGAVTSPAPAKPPRPPRHQLPPPWGAGGRHARRRHQQPLNAATHTVKTPVEPDVAH